MNARTHARTYTHARTHTHTHTHTHTQHNTHNTHTYTHAYTSARALAERAVNTYRWARNWKSDSRNSPTLAGVLLLANRIRNEHRFWSIDSSFLACEDYRGSCNESSIACRFISFFSFLFLFLKVDTSSHAQIPLFRLRTNPEWHSELR